MLWAIMLSVTLIHFCVNCGLLKGVMMSVAALGVTLFHCYS